MNKIKLLLADDHEMILDSLSRTLNGFPQLEVVARSPNGFDVLDKLKENEIDVAILDLNMPLMNGMECMEQIRLKYPEQKVLFLTIYQEEYVVKKLISCGAKGFLLKNVAMEKLMAAIEKINEGGEYFDDLPDIYKNKKKQPENNHDHLTPREKEIIKLTVQGLPSHEIAEKLFISEFTVNTHRKNVLKKLNLANIVQLVAFAKSSGILDN